MSISDEEDESLAQFLESEVLSQDSDKEEPGEEEPKTKRLCLEGQNLKDKGNKEIINNKNNNNNNRGPSRRIESGIFSKIPPELFPHILKFLSSEVSSPYFLIYCLNKFTDFCFGFLLSIFATKKILFMVIKVSNFILFLH